MIKKMGWILKLILLFVCMGTLTTYAETSELTNNNNLNSPIGYWKQYTDNTNPPELNSIIRIDEKNGQLEGRIIKTYKVDGVEPHKTCVYCTGALHNAPIIGLVIMTGVGIHPVSSMQWGGGTIVDPKNGKSYRVTLTLMDSGHQLKVHGYIGAPLFGRSQTWTRTVEPEEIKQFANNNHKK